MINFSTVKIGDYVIAEYEGTLWEGEVTGLNGEEKQICVLTDVQEFWFEPEHLQPIMLNHERLKQMGFECKYQDDGTVKYLKGPFRILLPAVDDFSTLEMWYREDKRHHPDVHFLHQLQHIYHDMTKVHLVKELV